MHYVWFNITSHYCFQSIQIIATVARDKILSDDSVLHSKKKLNDFMASKKWVNDFVKRHGAVSKLLHGEAGDTYDPELEANELAMLSVILDEYLPQNIYNVDETGLFYACMPARSYV